MKIYLSKSDTQQMLCVKLGRKESFDARELEQLSQGVVDGLLRPYAVLGTRGDVLQYDVSGFATLKFYLSCLLNQGQLVELVRHCIRIFRQMEQRYLHVERVVGSFEQIFVQMSQRTVWFAYLPVNSKGGSFSLPAFFQQLIDSAVCNTYEFTMFADQYRNFLRRPTAFSLNEFEAFIEAITAQGAQGQPQFQQQGRPAYGAPPVQPQPGYGGRPPQPNYGARPPVQPGYGGQPVQPTYGGQQVQPGYGGQPGPQRVSGAAAVRDAVMYPKPQTPPAGPAQPAGWSVPQYAPPAQPGQGQGPAGGTALLGQGQPGTMLLGEAPPPPPPPMPKGELIRQKTGERFPLQRPRMTVGRERGQVDILVADNPTVGREHAVITCRDGGFFLTDNKSMNKSYVDGVQLEPGEPYALKDGAEVKLSNEVFTFRLVQ